MEHFKEPNLKNFSGKKSACGLYQFIINEIPPHEIYFEMFLGTGAVLRHKKPSRVSHGIDCDQSVINAWEELSPQGVHIVHNDALYLLKRFSKIKKSCFFYFDPPYYYPSRRSPKAIYNCEFSDKDHEKLLKMICKLKHNCMISCYENMLYESYLSSWRKKTFKIRVHHNTVKEVIYMNYPEPTELHDYSYLGTDCRDRQRILRKIRLRLKALKNSPPQERNAILQAIHNKYPGSSIQN